MGRETRKFRQFEFKVKINESQFKQCGVTPHLSIG